MTQPLPSPTAAWNEAAAKYGAKPIPLSAGDDTEDELLLAEAIADLYAHGQEARGLYNGRELMEFEAHPEKIVRLARKLAEGQYRATAATLAGLTDRSVRSWMAEAEKGNPRFAAVGRAIAIAEARAMASAVRNVRAAGRLPQFWAAEMTYLERKNPDLWGRRSEEGNSPRVVVQIGVKDSDVTVNLATAASSSPPALTSGDEL